MQIDLITKPLQKKANSIIKFTKKLVKFINENHADERTYVRLVADKPNQIQYYGKSLPNRTTQQKNRSLIFH